MRRHLPSPTLPPPFPWGESRSQLSSEQNPPEWGGRGCGIYCEALRNAL